MPQIEVKIPATITVKVNVNNEDVDLDDLVSDVVDCTLDNLKDHVGDFGMTDTVEGKDDEENELVVTIDVEEASLAQPDEQPASGEVVPE